MQKQKITLIQLTLGLILILSTMWVIHDASDVDTVAASALSASVTQAEDISALHNPTAAAPNCRYGVSSWNPHDKQFVEDSGVGWVLNFGTSPGRVSTLPSGVEYTPIIRFKPNLDDDGNREGTYRLVSPIGFASLDSMITTASGIPGTIPPGSLWLIGNEVDRVDAQDDLMPDVYAMAYHDTYHFIKDRDPSAQIAISGLVQVTPGRLQYLDMVWDSYLEKYGVSMPVDVWNMHVYILPEKRQNGNNAAAAIALGTDPAIAILESGGDASNCSKDNVYCYAEHDNMAIFAEQVVAMRQWMKDHGQQNKPLILSEYSLLYPYTQEGDSDPNTCFLKDEYGNCFTPERVSNFLSDSFDYLETATDASIGFPADNHRLVQQWLWFTVYENYNVDMSSHLLESEATVSGYTLRLPGQTFIAKTDALRPFTSQSFISQVSYPTATTITPTGTISTTISATIYNNGNTITTESITVTFSTDEAGLDLIGTAVIPAGLIGCARNTAQAEIIWDNLDTGLHSYWVTVDGGNAVEGFVLINPNQVFLPIILR